MTLLFGLVLATQIAQATIPPGTPADVRRFVERRIRCNHWSGEEPYDAGRAAEIDRAGRILRCAAIARDERRLRARHARQPAVIRLLVRSRDWIE